ncbi:MAG: hypothetical protein LQ350_006492 [Teloschistes chrysophthalmus]|nr:MAG: hypothetical protein LQ350_006492 [Niorma chrysophthalma]
MAPPSNPDQRTETPLKILMLHGYTQSGPLFRSKTRALEKALTKAFPNHTPTLSYPTGPLLLSPSDIPGYDTSSTNNNPQDQDPEPSYGWWRRKDVPKGEGGETETTYTHLPDCFSTIAHTIRTEGPFDGVIGFSQGGCAAALVASLLEPGRRDSFPPIPTPSSSPSDPITNTTEPYPQDFISPNGGATIQPPLLFALLYSAFLPPSPRYTPFTTPPLTTPTLHFLGSLDSVVEEGRSRALIEKCGGAEVVVHPGGHFLPCQRVWLDAATGFIKRYVGKGGGEGGGKGNGEEERAEDMDVPF